jgi:antitoxin VapB
LALSILNSNVVRLARDLANTTGETLAVAIRRALEERLIRERARLAGQSLSDNMLEIQEIVARLPVLDARTADELIGYDEGGLPT